MGEIKIVVPGKTRGYSYPVCKNTYHQAGPDFFLILFVVRLQ